MFGVSPAHSKSLLIAGFCGLMIVGCDRTGSAPPSTTDNTTPATQAAQTDATSTAAAPATSPASTEPASSTLLIDNRAVLFPGAMLRLKAVDGKVVARLYSNDPKGMLSGAISMNSYDFEMTLPDVADPADIDQAVWQCKSASSDRQDTPYGIFLNDQQKLLQPMDVTVHFTGRPPNVNVVLQGTFWMYPMREDPMGGSAPVMVNVMASLDTKTP
jgi:hypothetical protein